MHARADISVQNPACIPNIPESRNWPVAGIYLHGLFEPGGEEATPFRRLEQANRSLLIDLAKAKHIRIAVPVAPAKGKWRSWNGFPLHKIEDLARAACGNAPLAEGRDLIAFSNGAINSQKFSCKETESYSHIFSIGAHPHEESGGTKPCGGENRFQASTPHNFLDGLNKFKRLIRPGNQGLSGTPGQRDIAR